MTLTKKRRGEQYFQTSDDSEAFMYKGEHSKGEAQKHFISKDYKRAVADYKEAMGFFHEALDRLDENDNDKLKTQIKGLLRESQDAYKRARRTSFLVERTETYNPLRRWFVRKIKGKHILASFLLCLVFSFPNITGNVIGRSSYFGIVGVLFFFLGIVLSYFYIKKQTLMNSF